MAQSARHIHPSRALADRPRRAPDRGRAHRAAARRRPHWRSRRDNPRPAWSGDVQQGQERRLPELAGTQPGCGRGRRLQGRAPLRGRRVGRHADLPRQRVRARRRAAVTVAHSADQPGAVPGGRAPLSGRAIRPQQPLHRQHDVVGRQGLAAVRRTPHAVRPAAARRQQLSSFRSRARSPTSTSPRSGPREPAWASTRPRTSRSISRSTVRAHMPWR